MKTDPRSPKKVDPSVLAEEVLAMCKKRGWSMHWMARGAYLHLEASELIESLRGKGDSSPLDEASDVLIVLMSITQNEGIDFSYVLEVAQQKVNVLMTKPVYKGEQRGGPGD